MANTEWQWMLLAVMFALYLQRIFTRKWRTWRSSVRARRRSKRAQSGEHRAERLLIAHGYTILDRQVSTTWSVLCDDEHAEISLRADLLVERDDEVFVAEVKTGEFAPSLHNSATRRQLLEYALAYNSPTILLVDVENEDVQAVSFLFPT